MYYPPTYQRMDKALRKQRFAPKQPDRGKPWAFKARVSLCAVILCKAAASPGSQQPAAARGPAPPGGSRRPRAAGGSGSAAGSRSPPSAKPGARRKSVPFLASPLGKPVQAVPVPCQRWAGGRTPEWGLRSGPWQVLGLLNFSFSHQNDKYVAKFSSWLPECWPKWCIFLPPKEKKKQLIFFDWILKTVNGKKKSIKSGNHFSLFRYGVDVDLND